MSRVARPRPTRSTPVASGSSVPACPTRRWPKIRRHRATTSWDVHPASLSTTTSPVTGSAPAGLIVGRRVRRRDRPGPRPGRLPRRRSPRIRRRTSSTRPPAITAGSARELEERGALHPGLAGHHLLQLGPALGQGLGRVLRERAHVDGGMAEVRGRVHRGHGDQAEPLVGVGQSLELLGHHLAQDLVDPQRPRIRGRTPIVMPTT